MAKVLRNPSKSDLVHAIHDNWTSMFYLSRKTPGWEWFEKPDATYFLANNEVQMFNRVEATKFTTEDADRRIAEVASLFKDKNRPFSWSINPRDTPIDLPTRLEKAGLMRSETPGMAIEIRNLKIPSKPEGFTIEKPKGTRELDAWARLMADAYGLGGMTEPFVNITHNISYCKEMLNYTGLLNGRPVATASVFLADGVAGVYCIATAPEARGRGIGSYITATPLLEAQEMGYEVSILHATKMGYPVYERLGFQEVCKKVSYSWNMPT
jgi:GNAT superfamily N-acetyltransferase